MGTDEFERISGPSYRPVAPSKGLSAIDPTTMRPAVSAHEKEGGAGSPGYQHHDGARQPYRGKDWKIEDLALPDGMLTEQVRKSLTEMMEEIDRLRWALENSIKRQEFLETQVDQASNLPILNRRAFLRQLGKFLERGERLSMTSALVYLYLETYEDIRREVSLEAAEAALQHLANVVNDGIRQTDVAGHVGGAGVAVILALAKEEVGVSKAWDFISEIQRSPFIFEGKQLKMILSVGVHEFGEDGDWETPEGALRSVDRNQHRRTVEMGKG